MNYKIKHVILFLFSLALLVATLFVLRRADNLEQMKNLWLGYPIPFISQDFSAYDKGFSYFPNYEHFEIHSQNPIKHFSVVNFLASFFIIFFLVETLVYLLENVKYWIKGRKE